MSQTQLPASLLTLLDGSLPSHYRHQVICLSSISENGWPYDAQLSCGEIIALSATQIRFAIWPGSTTAANLIRTGKASLTLVQDGAVIAIQALAEKRPETITEQQLAVFDLTLQRVITHRAPYAVVTQGITFTLNDEDATLARWRQQVTQLKAIPLSSSSSDWH